MRRRKRCFDESAEVNMSPLIDCVFLLLIFFLVTTTLKMKERHLVLSLPNDSAGINTQTNETILTLGVNKEGVIFKLRESKKNGVKQFEEINDFSSFLISQKNKDMAFRIECDRMTPFQKTIEILDACKEQGFKNIALKIKGE